jgi:hypothetical protein
MYLKFLKNNWNARRKWGSEVHNEDESDESEDLKHNSIV